MIGRLLMGSDAEPCMIWIKCFGHGRCHQGENVGQAYLFDMTTGDLLRTFDDPTVTTSDNFGISVAIDGDNVVIGAHGDNTRGNNVGQAHLFNATSGVLLHTFESQILLRGRF